MIHMNAKVVGIGTTILVSAIFAAVVVAPRYTNPESSRRSANYRERTPLEERGLDLYITHGCQYCHSQYVRTVDWGLGAERLAAAGDYAGELAPQLGSIRNGPDLSQQGGEHTVLWKPRGKEGARLPSGTFLIRLTTDQFVATREVVLVR